MAWVKENNSGEGGNAIWTQVDSIIWTSTVIWTGTVWDKEARISALWTKEAKSAELWTKEV